ncbi:MAG: hypothetical protein IPJ87_16175 [Flavobacteriales bacterium]|jgi:hypothetical protein|nr:hypothetical protein [Flavobacteriales bacterium]MBK7943385.1 hypothetical protein [Flavobacteriales bacterium]MBK8948036.1 hypothetical protein [Flavobacteriales bacterium]MBK9699925.1 hypothetical protein [Flavobacteriales bacterium]
MSWDIYIQDLPPVRSANEIPEHFRPRPIGERDLLAARIRKVFPMADAQDGDWFFVNAPGMDLSLQLHLEDASQVRYILVHVHGGPQSAAGIAALLRELGLRALDTATGDLFDAETLEEGL